MEVRLLGTGAADGIPGFYCQSPVCEFARENGGKDIRTRSAALIDGEFKIDLPPDTLCQMQRDRLDVKDWTALFFTHSHEDHFAPAELQYALYPFTDLERLPYAIYGNGTIVDQVYARYPDWPIELVQTHVYQPVTVGHQVVTPVRAYHKDDEECQNLLFQTTEKSLLYATDTGIWMDETFEFLASVKLDGLVIECTEGFRRSDYRGHLNLEDLYLVLERLRKQGTVADSTRIVTTHHAHTGLARHCDLEVALAPMKAEPGYDGMVFNV